MIRRTQKLSKNHSLLLFGARGTGKSTLLRTLFPQKNTLWIDLLKDSDEEIFSKNPGHLSQILEAKKYSCVVIDEIQKVPKLLDIVHLEIEKKRKIQFILTGSSARKLKRGAANLLAGRAFTYHLYPFTHVELDRKFHLDQCLKFGSLPEITSLENDEDRMTYLRSYVKTYLREEIRIEQIVRQIDPFRNFLEIAAQTNGQILNYSKIARDLIVSDKTVREYFQILEDTLLGFHLPSFHRSIRKQQRQSPKFFLFDPGIKRTLDSTLRLDLIPKTYAYGKAFEHWIQLEVFRLNEYFQLDYKMSYLLTKDNAEIDLIIQRPGQKDLLIEIKSTNHASIDDVRVLQQFYDSWDQPCEAQVWSLDPQEKMIGSVKALPWYLGIQESGLSQPNP